MPVGTTADFDVTRDELVRGALRLLGVTEPSTTEINQGVETLNILIRHLDAKSEHLHAISHTESTLTLIANQQAYATGSGASLIATNILSLEYAAILIGTDRDDLIILDSKTALRTPLKSDSASQPVACHLEEAKLLANKRLLFYPTPNSAYTFKYHYRRPLYDFDTVTDNPDMPSEFIKPLKTMLAHDLAPEYGTPLQERELLARDGERWWAEAINAKSSRPSYEPLQAEYF